MMLSLDGFPRYTAPTNLLPMLSLLPLLCMCSLHVCSFSGLVYDLLLGVVENSAQRRIARRVSHLIRVTGTAWITLRFLSASYQSGGAPFFRRYVSW